MITRESLTSMIHSADPEKRARIIGRALVAIFRRQTDHEKSSNITLVYNNIGFTGADAYSGSLGAKSYLKYGTLPQWVIDMWMKPNKNGVMRIAKYWSQLDQIAREKAALKEAA